VLCFGELINEYLVCNLPPVPPEGGQSNKNLEKLSWTKMSYAENSDFKGGVSYAASCMSADNKRLMITGGYQADGKLPLSRSY